MWLSWSSNYCNSTYHFYLHMFIELGSIIREESIMDDTCFCWVFITVTSVGGNCPRSCFWNKIFIVKAGPRISQMIIRFDQQIRTFPYHVYFLLLNKSRLPTKTNFYQIDICFTSVRTLSKNLWDWCLND